MTTKNTLDYFSEKKKLLKQCLAITEEFFSTVLRFDSSVDNPNEINDILELRGKIIHQLEKLDQTTDKDCMASCSAAEKQEINQLVSLLLNLDEEASTLVKRELSRLTAAMKVHSAEQKIIPYSSGSFMQGGSLMDLKK